ncbi:MAG: rod shape-determining protein RodA [Rhodospirillaceae bacterium]|nr:rod shape-determining protein RodA [Rhodospirillaceae bacterium]
MAIMPSRQLDLTLGQKLWQVNWGLVFLITVTASVGFGMLYSAASGEFAPWATRQMMRFGVGLVLMIIVAVSNIHFWLRYAYIIYIASFSSLIFVELFGSVGMGAQRWIDLGFMSLQPSEVMKSAVILALARYFYASRMEDVERFTYLMFPLMLVAAPMAMIIRQPDLGTALLLAVSGVAVFFLAGVRLWVFVAAGIAAIGAIVPVWHLVLLDYQKARLLTYLRPEQDPLGSGYHVMQSKIALGSGGIFGKGFLAGSQSHLSFLPEKHTDFIFTMLAEEFGMMGGLTLIGLYALLLIYGFAISLRCRHHFGRLLGMGIMTMFFLNFFVNVAMVMGLLPVVGMPLPLVSYGGSAMLTLMFGFGLLLNVYVHRDVYLGPGAADGNV